MGQQEQQEDAGAEDAAVGRSPHGTVETGMASICDTFGPLTQTFPTAPGLLRECGGHPERQQPHQHLHRRQDVLLESGHAVPAAGRRTAQVTRLIGSVIYDMTTDHEHLRKCQISADPINVTHK